MNFKKSALALALTASLGFATTATASPSVGAPFINASFTGVFTMLSPVGGSLINTSYPYSADPTWGYGLRTQISGTFSFNASTGFGMATVNPFDFMNGGLAVPHDITLQAIGDGVGGQGSLIAGGMLFDWNSTSNISVGIVFDAAGFFNSLLYGGASNSQAISGVGAIPASNTTNNMPNSAPAIGPAPLATTTWNTDYNVNPGCVMSNTCLTSNDTIGGDPMDNGPFPGNSANFDITYIHLEGGGCQYASMCPPPVPVPAAAWLFGSGLLGLIGVARRKAQR